VQAPRIVARISTNHGYGNRIEARELGYGSRIIATRRRHLFSRVEDVVAAGKTARWLR
jgi:hypothetical protein